MRAPQTAIATKPPFRVFLFLLALTLALPLAAQGQSYTVRSGDTLYGISRKFGVSVSSIAKANGMRETDRLIEGSKLAIPGGAAGPSAKPGGKLGEYTVKPGDTLYGIARERGMGLSELLSLNSLKEGSPLRVGAKLKVTLGDTETVPTSGSPAPSQSSQAQKASPSPRANPSPRVNPSPKPSPTPAATGGIKALTWPVAGEVAYMDGLLYGVTITGKKGDPVRAVAGGTVIRADFFRGYSDVVFVQREDKTIYVYSGNDGILVRKGDVIQSGTKIGYLGIDPKTNKAILSFMVFKNGKALDPYTSPRD